VNARDAENCLENIPEPQISVYLQAHGSPCSGCFISHSQTSFPKSTWYFA